MKIYGGTRIHNAIHRQLRPVGKSIVKQEQRTSEVHEEGRADALRLRGQPVRRARPDQQQASLMKSTSNQAVRTDPEPGRTAHQCIATPALVRRAKAGDL